MRAKTFLLVLALTASAAVFAGAAGARQDGNLYYLVSESGSAKVYIGEISDASTAKKADTADLKEKIKSALAARRSVHFEVVPSAGEADLAIEANITDFVWSNSDPLDMIAGVGMIAMDAAVTECYVRMEAVFKVTDPKTAKTLWTQKVTSTVTKADMNEEAAVKLVNEDMAKVFVRDCFSKRRAGAKRK